MFGRLEGRILPVTLFAAGMVMAHPGNIWGQAWELERERGVGGGAGGTSAKVALQTGGPGKTGGKVGVRIVISPDDAPVGSFGDAEQVQLDIATKAAGAAPASRSGADDIRPIPPADGEILKSGSPKRIETTVIGALPSATQSPRPAARPHMLTDAPYRPSAPIEQAQFSPNATAAAKVILPSPKKPVRPEASVQQAVLAPNVIASPKENVLRTAPPPPR